MSTYSSPTVKGIVVLFQSRLAVPFVSRLGEPSEWIPQRALFVGAERDGDREPVFSGQTELKVMKVRNAKPMFHYDFASDSGECTVTYARTAEIRDGCVVFRPEKW